MPVKIENTRRFVSERLESLLKYKPKPGFSVHSVEPSTTWSYAIAGIWKQSEKLGRWS
jgi:hypothetical protein